MGQRQMVDDIREAFRQLPKSKKTKAVIALCNELDACIRGDRSDEQLGKLRKAYNVVMEYTAKGERQPLQVLLSLVGTKIDLRQKVFRSAVYTSVEPLHSPPKATKAAA